MYVYLMILLRVEPVDEIHNRVPPPQIIFHGRYSPYSRYHFSFRWIGKTKKNKFFVAVYDVAWDLKRGVGRLVLFVVLVVPALPA